jgi:tRNA modification GTPase
MYQDTIAALSTPMGEAGIGIVRLSGEEARSIGQRLFTGQLVDHQLTYGHVVDPQTGDRVDEVLVSYMAAPHTYTREDIVEINCHSGPLVLQRILGLALNCGARLATPGEFTLRGFLNGRIDLAQAEAVLDVLQAKTEVGLRLAVEGLGGRLSTAVRDIRSMLMSLLAYLTAMIDFPEDNVEQQEVLPPLREVLAQLQQLIASADDGIVYRQGVRTAIVGRPNVGKSSLLNRLLGQDRAIVTPVPGTTRDTIEEVVNLRGVPFLLVDTAGLIASEDIVEALGVERSRRAIAEADFVLTLVDISEPITEADREIIASAGARKSLTVANKSDLSPCIDGAELPGDVVLVSALTGEGMPELEAQMVNVVLRGEVGSSEALLVSNPRHKEALERAGKHLSQAISGVEAGVPEDLISIDLTAAVGALGEITGETVTDELLDAVFSQFCLGK